MINEELVNNLLIEPIRQGADKLVVVSGYATPMMASWHVLRIKELKLPAVSIVLHVGMFPSDGIPVQMHEGFQQLVKTCRNDRLASFSCRYVTIGHPVHSKVYLWMKGEYPAIAFAGSPNYTQAAFDKSRREYAVPCDEVDALKYCNEIAHDTLDCTDTSIGDHVGVRYPTDTQNAWEKNETAEINACLSQKSHDTSSSVFLPLLTNRGETGYGSGINWGHRRNGVVREPNQAYISLPASIAHTGFFPLEKRHFSVITDDGHTFMMRVEQENDKAITTPLDNSEIGRYLRMRLGLPPGEFVQRVHLEKYGRTGVTFTKLGEELFQMDFSV